MIEILCSGVSLGHYLPGLLVRDRLRALGVRCTVRVYERYLEESRRLAIPATRHAYHTNIRIAKTAQRLARTLAPALDRSRVTKLLEAWADEHSRLIIISGYWVPLVRSWLADRADRERIVEILHVDSSESPVWRAVHQGIAGLRRSWLCSAESSELIARLPVACRAAATRGRRVVVHGGGWGIGDYRDVVDRLLDAGYGVDLVAYEEADISRTHPGLRYLLIDPTWQPLSDDREPGYPPLRVIGDLAPATSDHHLFSYIRNATAIVSKPGGATLIDSLEAATPIAFVAPFGDHEGRNRDLWVGLGCGVPFDAWQAEAFSDASMAARAETLRALRERTPSYPDELIRRIGAE
jgi:hypothetical protein